MPKDTVLLISYTTPLHQSERARIPCEDHGARTRVQAYMTPQCVTSMHHTACPHAPHGASACSPTSEGIARKAEVLESCQPRPAGGQGACEAEVPEKCGLCMLGNDQAAHSRACIQRVQQRR